MYIMQIMYGVKSKPLQTVQRLLSIKECNYDVHDVVTFTVQAAS